MKNIHVLTVIMGAITCTLKHRQYRFPVLSMFTAILLGGCLARVKTSVFAFVWTPFKRALSNLVNNDLKLLFSFFLLVGHAVIIIIIFNFFQ